MHLLQNTLQSAIKKGQSVDLIKEQILRQAREHLEESARKMAQEHEKRKRAEARTGLISVYVDDAIKRFPPVDRYLVTSALARMTNLETPIDKVKVMIDAIAQNWQADYLKRTKIRPSKSKHAKSQGEPSHPRIADERMLRNSLNGQKKFAKSSVEPFNSSMADELGRFLAVTKKPN